MTTSSGAATVATIRGTIIMLLLVLVMRRRQPNTTRVMQRCWGRCLQPAPTAAGHSVAGTAVAAGGVCHDRLHALVLVVVADGARLTVVGALAGPALALVLATLAAEGANRRRMLYKPKAVRRHDNWGHHVDYLWYKHDFE